MTTYAEVLGIKLVLLSKEKSKEKTKEIREKKQIEKDKEEMKGKSLNRELQNIINSLNQQIMHMKEIIVTMCAILIKDPIDKKELMEKIQRIEEVDKYKTKEENQVMEIENAMKSQLKEK